MAHTHIAYILGGALSATASAVGSVASDIEAAIRGGAIRRSVSTAFSTSASDAGLFSLAA